MTLPLFAYGTLRDPRVVAAVLDRRLRPERHHAARAPGFRAVAYPGRIYPAFIRVPGATADGLLITDLTPFERDLLDVFEGAEYRRAPIAVLVEEDLFEADAYLPSIPVRNTGATWSLSHWQAIHKPRVLDAKVATASDIRTRLIAMRPH